MKRFSHNIALRFSIFHICFYQLICFLYFATGRCLLRQCNTTVPAINILVTLLEDQELLSHIDIGYIDTKSEEKLRRRLQCPQQELPLLVFRMTCMAQRILSSNISDIKDETAK